MPLTMRATGLALPTDWPHLRAAGRAEDHMRWFWSLYGVVGKPPKVHTKRPCGDARGGARIARRGA